MDGGGGNELEQEEGEDRGEWIKSMGSLEGGREAMNDGAGLMVTALRVWTGKTW